MKSGRRGFTVLEMIVATALMGIAVAGLLSLLSAALSNGARARQYDRAAMLARTKMNELLSISPLPLDQPLSGEWEAGVGWRARADVFERPAGAQPGAFQLVRVQLEVWWSSRGQTSSFQLEGYRREIIQAGLLP